MLRPALFLSNFTNDNNNSLLSIAPMNKILSLIFVLSICSIASAQTGSRITSFAYYGADTTLPCTDTGGYNAYSYERGGEMLFGTSYFDCDFPFQIKPTVDYQTNHHGLTKFDSSWKISTVDTEMCTQAFDANNNIASAFYYWYTGGAFSNRGISSYTYDANNNLLEESDSIPPSDWITHAAFTYDALNRIISYTAYPMPPQLASQALYTYDTAGNLIVIDGYQWDSATTAWQLLDKRTIWYNAIGQPVSFLINYYTPGVSYDSGYNYFSPANDTMIANTGGLLTTNTYDATHNKICTIQIANPLYNWLTTSKTLWTYNSFNQVTAERYFTMDSTGSWVFNNLKRFYYGAYADAVPSIATNTTSFEVFPSPAQNKITVKVTWPETQVNTTISILNAAGQIVRQLHEPQVQQLEKNIDITTLPTGNYFVIAVAATQKLVQQLVVAH